MIVLSMGYEGDLVPGSGTGCSNLLVPVVL